MNDIVIFGIGTFVTAMVTGSIALLAWATWTSEDSSRSSNTQEPEVIRLVKPSPEQVQHRGSSSRQVS